MSALYFDHRWGGAHGIGRFAIEVRRRLAGFTDLPLGGSPTHPADSIRLAQFLHRAHAKFFLSPGFNVPLWSRCQVIATIHDLIHVHFPMERTSAKLAYYRWIQRRMIRNAPVTLTVSEFSRRQIVEWYGVPEGRVVSVGNGVSEAFYQTTEPKQLARPYFLYVGNSKPHKNLGVLLDAMKRLSADHDVELVMVMHPDRSLQSEVVRRGLEGRLTIRGGMDDWELASWYRGAVALVLPSLYEGFGLPIVEAMASGCPVIGSDRTAIPEVIGNAGLIFNACDPSELECRMRQLLSDESLRGWLCGIGRLRADKFRWDSVASRIRNAISNFTPISTR